jgi:hypothetical protein
MILLGDAYTASAMAWKTPIWATVYRYIGRQGVSGATAGVGLEDAYRNGHSINADAGAVTFNASNGYAPVQITPSVSAPSNGLSAGQLCTVNNILYQYNGSKWLSVSQEGVSFAARFGCGNYLTSDIQGAAGTGFTAIQKGTILGLTGSVGWGAMNKNFSIMKNGVFAPIQAFSMAAGKIMNSNLNIDFDAGDIIQIYFEANAQAFSPRIELTIAWRL